jgi:hypothetical protein
LRHSRSKAAGAPAKQQLLIRILPAIGWIVSGVNAVNPGLIDTQIARDVSGDEQAYGEIAKSVPHAVALQSRRELRGGRLPRLGLAIPRQKD